MLSQIKVPEFTALKAEIEAHPRVCGHYLIGLVSIAAFRVQGVSQEEILERLVEYFEDDPNAVDPNFVSDHAWSDYEVSEVRARDHTIESLMGGPNIGHTAYAMDESIAENLLDRFVAICGPNPRFYTGLGLGDSQYVFMYGVLIVADEMAGLLWIVESD